MAAVGSVLQGSLLSWLAAPPGPSQGARCPVLGAWHFPAHDYDAPGVGDTTVMTKFLEQLEDDSQDDDQQNDEENPKDPKIKRKINGSKDEKGHKTLLIVRDYDEHDAYPWRYMVNLFSGGFTFYGGYTSQNPALSSITLNLRKVNRQNASEEA